MMRFSIEVIGVLSFVISWAALGQSDFYASSRDFVMAMSLEGSRNSGGARAASNATSRAELEVLMHSKVAAMVEGQGFRGVDNQYHTIMVDEEEFFGVMLVETPAMSDVLEVMDGMWYYPEVLWVNPNYIYLGDFMESVSNDPDSAKQGHLPQIFAEAAWGEWRGGDEPIIVAVTDDGFDLGHEDMQGTFYQNPQEISDNEIDDDDNGYVDDVWGWNFNENNGEVLPKGGYGAHGTHIAGIIAADTLNSLGIAGVASAGVQVLPLKWYGKQSWTSAMVYETYAYAVKQGARIISTSYSIDLMSDDPTYLEALDFVYRKGVLVFNSAGNNDELNPMRGALEKLLLVASVQTGDPPSGGGDADRRSDFSNYGDGIDLAAPGDPIWATYPDSKYGNMRGTSMAAPVAAAVAAMVWSQFPDMTANQVAHKLLTTTDDISAVNSDEYFYLGTGRVNAYTALEDYVRPLQVVVTGNYVGQEWSDVRELTVRFYGVAEYLDSPFGVLWAGADGVFDTADDRWENIRYSEESFYGGNYKVIQFAALDHGEYRFFAFAEGIIDPFGYPLDGDADGESGGDYVVEFSVR